MNATLDDLLWLALWGPPLVIAAIGVVAVLLPPALVVWIAAVLVWGCTVPFTIRALRTPADTGTHARCTGTPVQRHAATVGSR